MKISRIAAALGMVLATAVSAGPWEISLGLVARDVGDFEVKSDTFANPAFPGSPYVTGMFGVGGQPELALLADPDRQGRPFGVATLHRMDFDGLSEGLDSSLGVLLAARTSLGEKWDRIWFLDVNVMWFGSDASASSNAVPGISEHFAVVPGTWDVFGPNTVLTTSGVGSNQGGVYGLYDIDLELDAFTFGVGIGSDVDFALGSLRLEVGPTLTVVDYDAKATVDIRWDSDHASVFAGGPRTVKDSGVDLLPGFYGDLSFVHHFNERFGIGIGVRYDYLFEKLDTDLGKVDLKGLSGNVKAVFRF